jgi:hypothetical protein
MTASGGTASVDVDVGVGSDRVMAALDSGGRDAAQSAWRH